MSESVSLSAIGLQLPAPSEGDHMHGLLLLNMSVHMQPASASLMPARERRHCRGEADLTERGILHLDEREGQGVTYVTLRPAQHPAGITNFETDSNHAFDHTNRTQSWVSDMKELRWRNGGHAFVFNGASFQNQANQSKFIVKVVETLLLCGCYLLILFKMYWYFRLQTWWGGGQDEKKMIWKRRWNGAKRPREGDEKKKRDAESEQSAMLAALPPPPLGCRGHV